MTHDKANDFHVTEDYKMTTDPHNWVVWRKKTVTKQDKSTEEKWEDIGFHPTMKTALARITEDGTRLAGAKSIDELIAAHDRMTEAVE